MTPIETPHRGARTKIDTSVFDRHDLENGAVVWLQRPGVDLSEAGVLVAYFVNVGSILDPEGKEHTAHFLEHMPFKGTKSFPNTEQLEGTLKEVGGHMNASTARYWTNYRVHAPREGFDRALDVLRGLIREPLLRPEDFETERGIILSEQERRFESGNAVRARDVSRALFGDHPIARWAGSLESIRAIKLEDVLRFRQEHYHAGNLHLVVGGAFSSIPDVLARIQGAFEDMAGGERSVIKLPPLEPLAAGPLTLVNPHYGRHRYSLNWLVRENVSRESDRALGLLVDAFASGMDSPLALELRDRRGLVYEDGLLSSAHIRDLGEQVELELPIAKGTFEEIWDTVQHLLATLPDERLARELERWQIGRLSRFVFPTKACTDLGTDLADYGRPITYHESEELSDGIDLEEVRRWRDFIVKTPPLVIETGTE